MNGQPLTIRNRLLTAFPADALEALRAELSPVAWPRGASIEMSGAHVPSAYFLEEGAVSIMIGVGEERFELVLVGREGMLGIPSLLGTAGARCGALVVLACKAYAVPVMVFQRLLREQPAARGITLRFAQTQVTQLAHNSFANSHLTTLRRVARWLLMARDRNDGDMLMIAQSTLSVALGLHRPRVTEALHRLQEMKTIRSERALVTVIDRDKLASVAGPSYGPAEHAYDSLIAGQAGPRPACVTAPEDNKPEPARSSAKPYPASRDGPDEDAMRSDGRGRRPAAWMQAR